MWHLCAEHTLYIVNITAFSRSLLACSPWVTGKMVYRLIDGVRRVRVGLARAEARRLRSWERPWSSEGQGAQGKDGQDRTHVDGVVSYGGMESPLISVQELNSAAVFQFRHGWTLYVTTCKEPERKSHHLGE